MADTQQQKLKLALKKTDTSRVKKDTGPVQKVAPPEGEKDSTMAVPPPQAGPTGEETTISDPMAMRDAGAGDLARVQPEGAGGGAEEGEGDAVRLKVIREKKKELAGILTASQTIKLRPSSAPPGPATPEAAAAEAGEPTVAPMSARPPSHSTVKVELPPTPPAAEAAAPVAERPSKTATATLRIRPGSMPKPPAAAAAPAAVAPTAAPLPASAAPPARVAEAEARAEAPTTPAAPPPVPAAAAAAAAAKPHAAAASAATIKISVPRPGAKPVPAPSPAAAPHEDDTVAAPAPEAPAVTLAADAATVASTAEGEPKKGGLRIKAAGATGKASKLTLKMKGEEGAGKTVSLSTPAAGAAGATTVAPPLPEGEEGAAEAAEAAEAGGAKKTLKLKATQAPTALPPIVQATQAEIEGTGKARSGDEPGVLVTLAYVATVVALGAATGLTVLEVLKHCR